MTPRPLFLLLACAALALAPAAAFADAQKPAEPGPWKFGEIVSLNLSQSSFSTNWSGGDQGSIVWVAGSASTAERQLSKHFNNTSSLILAYGQTTQQALDPAHPGQRVWDSPIKTTDQILFESAGRWTYDAFVDPYVALRAESQFKDQSNPAGVLNLNPVKLKETAGIARVLQKSADAEAITRFGFGFRQAFGRVLVTTSPRATASFSSNDGGFEWQTNVKRPVLNKKVLYTGSLLVFQPVFYSKSSALETFDAAARAADPTRESVKDYWKATNVNFQNVFSAQITKSLSVNLLAQWAYLKYDAATNLDPTQPIAVQAATVDRSIRKAGQYKETLALGFSYRLF
jgi:hypothetical protein